MLGLCREAGLVSVGVIVIDGTRIKANASMDQNRSYREIITQILREAEETDRREAELCGDARGDELPEELRTPDGPAAEAFASPRRRAAARRPPAARLIGSSTLELPLAGRTGVREGARFRESRRMMWHLWAAALAGMPPTDSRARQRRRYLSGGTLGRFVDLVVFPRGGLPGTQSAERRARLAERSCH